MGNTFGHLLESIMDELPPQAADVLLRCFQFKEYEVVSWPAFLAAIHTCLLYDRFLVECEALFHQLARGGSTMDALLAYNRAVTARLMFAEPTIAAAAGDAALRAVMSSARYCTSSSIATQMFSNTL